MHVFFSSDFNAHSLSWWPNVDTNAEGLALDNLLTTLDLSDQPNVVMESGVRPSPDHFCKHQMTFCNLNLHIPPPVY